MQQVFQRLCYICIIAALSACAPQQPPASDNGTAQSSVSSSALRGIYNDPDGHYSVHYPANWQVRVNDTLMTDTAEYTGTAFLVPPTLYAGTDLLDARIHVTLADTCPQLADAEPATVEGRVTLAAEWSGAAAGNRYEGEVYMLDQNGKCAVLTLYKHSCNLGTDCGEDHDEPFENKDALQTMLEQMTASVQIAEADDADSPVACTLDAKLCPDGSYVGRVPPDCSFALCPGEEEQTE